MRQISNFQRWLGTSLAILCCLLVAGLPVRAQQTEAIQQAAQLALQTRAQWAGADIAAANFRISNAYTEPSGLLYAYPQQLQAGIPVYNRIATLVFKGGRLAHHAGSFLPAVAFAGQPATPTVAAATAVAKALASTKVRAAEQPASLSPAQGVEQQQTFSPAGVAHRPIEVRLVWATDKGKPRLAWNVNVDLLATPDWLNIRVDAATGQVLGQDNWTVQEKATHPATAPVRQPVASASPARAPQALRHPGSAKSTAAVASASYRVVPIPGERPDVTTPRVETNPWLRAGTGNPAATYGWHSIGTADYTYTRGNNVWAYKDTLDTDIPTTTYSTSSTGSASSLVFNDIPDFTKTPTLGKNRRAAVTNLFYWNNLVHDVMYQYGFTEPAGNFQANNLSRGGAGNDYVNAEAQDGGGTNNANFSTPPDGTNGRMQMYLFNGIVPPYYINVTAPSAVAGNYLAVESDFSTNNKLATRGPLSGQLALYADANTNPTTSLACNTYATLLTGKVALLYRGNCSFTTKVKNAQLAGAVAAIVINNVSTDPFVMAGTDNTITIPAVMISQADGARLVAQINNSVQVTLPKPAAVGPQLDGDYDNGVMVHEYGHGISNRLTGGGTNTSCLYNSEQAGEGWSDYFALMMTTDWSTAQTTDGTKARPVGTYVLGQAPTAGGIRRYPYSTNMSVNPLTYANMAASPEVHDIGEIWCATVWDMTWNIIQMQGTVEANLYNSASTGGNAVALQLVMQGLKLQPCQPGFLDSRDAILAADSLLYNGRYHCAIWGAFARRGMGYSAREGSSNITNDQTAAYDVPNVTLTRNTNILTGNRFNIAIKANCECPAQQNTYTITDQLPTDLQYLSSSPGGSVSGSTVTFANQTFTAGQTRTYQIQARTANGKGCAVALPINDNRETNTTGGLTPAVVSGTSAWAPTTTAAHSGTTSWLVPCSSTSANATLTSAAFTPNSLAILSFYHYANLTFSDGAYDGGLVAISTDNGTTWTDAAPYFLKNGYDATFIDDVSVPTALVGKTCFSGRFYAPPTPDLFTESQLDLSSFSGQSVRIRFQMLTNTLYKGTDYGFTGWYLDDVQVRSGCGGKQQVQLLASGSASPVTSYLTPTFLTPIPAPTILSFTPTSGPVGTQVTINGTNLDGATLIRFGGTTNNTVSTGYTVSADGTSITGIVVPSGAATGPISVTTPSGTATSTGSFTVTLPVTAAPVLTQPANNSTTSGRPTYAGTAPAGSTVTIYLAAGNGAYQPIGTTTTTGGSFSFTPTTALASGSYAAYATAQSSGSSVSANSNTNTFTVDATAPTATLSTTASSPTNTAPIPFAVSFSEPVTGLAASGISVTNGTVTSGSLSGSGSGPYTFSVTPTASGTVTVSILANAAQDAVGNGNVASNAVSVTYSPLVTLTWNGNGGQDWNTATNWTPNQVPTASTDALIPGNVRFYPIVPATGAATRNLTLQGPGTITQSAGTLTVNGNLSSSGAITKSAGTIAVTGSLTNSGTLTQSGGDVTVAGSLSNNAGGTVNQAAGTIALNGDLTNNATFTTGAGTVLLGGGAAASAILGSSAIRFFNLTVQAGGAQLSTSAGASVRRVLTLTGSLATTGNVFTIESSSAGDALVVNNGGVVTGTATVQRYIDPSLNRGLGYRQYSAPVSGSTVADLATTGSGGSFAPVVNPAYNAAAAPTGVSPFPTVYGYDQARLATASNNLSAFDKGYFSPASLSDPLTVGRGYTVNINYDQLVDFQGTLNTGDLPLSLSRNAVGTPNASEAGWHLVGNPYPAPLSYNLVAASDRVNLDGAIYVFSSTSQYGGQYRAYQNGMGNPVIPMGQAFFVRVASTATSGALTFRNAQRLTVPNNTTFQRPAETRPLVQLRLQGTSSPLRDELYVYFEPGATAGFDPAFDAEKLTNPSGLNLSSSLSASQGLAIDGRAPLGTAQLVVPLIVGVPAAGSYVLAAAQLLNLSTVPTYLRDKQTGALVDLAQQPTYQFTVGNAATASTGRFELVFSPQQPLATVPAALAEQVLVYPNPARTQVAIELPARLGRQPVTATLVDALGRPVRQQQLPAGSTAHQFNLAGLASGVYALRLTTDQGTVVKKLTLE